MKNNGGIFSGPNALGLSDSSSGVTCNPDNPTLVKKVQTFLKTNGAPNLKVDGVWQGCTASAFRNYTGRPYVTSDDIYKMTGDTCKSADTLLGGIIPAFTLSAINVCNDGSDGVPTGGGGGGGTAPQQQCAEGQVWNDLLRTCIADPFGWLGGGGGGTTTPPQQQCPQGQVWNDLVKQCLPDMGNLSLPVQLPGTSAPSECPSGTVKLPDGTCLGAGGVSKPTECPQGTSKIGGQCVSVPGGGGTTSGGGILDTVTSAITSILGGAQPTQPGQPSQPAGSGVPGINDLITGATGVLSNLLGLAKGSATCAPGMVLDPTSGQCIGPGGTSVPPGWTNPEVSPASGESPWGAMHYAIAGVVAIGAAAAGYMIYKSKHEAVPLEMPLEEDPFDADQYELELLKQYEEADRLLHEPSYDQYDPYAYGYVRNKRKYRR